MGAYAKSTVSREILAKTLPEHTVYQCEVTETLLKGQDDLFRSNRLTLSSTELLTRLLHYNFTLFLTFSSLCLSFFLLACLFLFLYPINHRFLLLFIYSITLPYSIMKVFLTLRLEINYQINHCQS